MLSLTPTSTLKKGMKVKLIVIGVLASLLISSYSLANDTENPKPDLAGKIVNSIAAFVEKMGGDLQSASLTTNPLKALLTSLFNLREVMTLEFTSRNEGKNLEHKCRVSYTLRDTTYGIALYQCSIDKDRWFEGVYWFDSASQRLVKRIGFHPI